jgi:hypothetical protein
MSGTESIAIAKESWYDSKHTAKESWYDSEPKAKDMGSKDTCLEIEMQTYISNERN